MPLHRRQFSLSALGVVGLGASALSWAAHAQAAAGVAAAAPLGSDPGDEALKAAIAGDWRTPAFRARDAARHPFETLHFFGLRPDLTVIEVSPGGGWYTEILAPYLRDRGEFYATAEAADDPNENRRKSRAAFEGKLAAKPAVFGKVKLGVMPRGPVFVDIAPKGGADLVLTFRNIHNWIQGGHLDNTLRAFHAVLKPGGVLGVEEHRAPEGSTVEWTKDNGYVAEAYLIERAKAAGFELQARSDVNNNPRDTKNHPNGVWSLPPTLAGGEADKARFLAIGESDRFTHHYVKARG
jgi:predicted methyltransferase